MWKTRFADILSVASVTAQSFSDANALKQANLPGNLYKYREFSPQNLDILRTGKVWLAAPSSFNDPFDSAVLFDCGKVIDEIRDSQEKSSSKGKSLLFRMIQGDNCGLPSWLAEEAVRGASAVLEKFTDPLVERATRELRYGLGICCFSENVASVPMWAHYAGGHSGFCIEWDLSLWTPAQQVLDHLFPVIYDQRAFQMPSLVLNPPFDGAESLLALRKASDWSYEREWRYVARTPPGVDGALQELPHPTAVYAGPQMSAQNRKDLSQLCHELGIKQYQMTCDLARGRITAGEAGS